MPVKRSKSRIRRLIYGPLILLLVVLILVYNPISIRLMTVGVAAWYGVDAGIFYRLVNTESRFRSLAVSPASAIGLGQVKESTAKYIHVQHKKGMLFVPFYNLRMSARYIRYLQGRFNKNWTLVLAAYNWGESNVEQRMQGVTVDPSVDYREYFSDIPETYDYINKILPDTKKA